MLAVDFHVHSIASVHALNSIEELLQTAEKKGMEGFAITDHSPGIDNTIWLLQNKADKISWSEQIKGPDLPYFMTMLFRYQQPLDTNVRLFKGIECNILSEGERATDVPDFIAHHFDIVIASIHPLPSLFNFKNADQVTERMILAMNDSIDIIGHPNHQNNCPLIEPLVISASKKGIALELNNASLKLGKANFEQTKTMLHLAKQYDCRISLSSDAHMSNELGNDEMTARMLEDTSFPKELIVNHSLQAAVDFSDERKAIRTARKA